MPAQPAAPVFLPQIGHAGSVNCIAVTPDSHLLASAGADGSVRVWDLATGLLVRTIFAHSGAIRSMVLHPSGRFAATSGDDRHVRVWTLTTGALMWESKSAVLARYL